MKYWQMAMRDGSRGHDMFDRCRLRDIAAITYENLRDVDLTPYSREDRPPQWFPQKGFSPGSMANFAFEIKGGDVIFVKDSLERGIVGCGVVRGDKGARAYRFEESHPVLTDSGYPWRHYMNVDWVSNYAPVPHVARAPLISVLQLNPDEIAKFGGQLCKQEATDSPDIASALGTKLLEASYLRYSSAALIEVVPRHRILSNEFAAWIRSNGGQHVVQESECIDMTFRMADQHLMVEFKVCYGGNTTAAIREALGQIFEYNLRSTRQNHHRWLLVLDTPPFGEDRDFVSKMRNEHNAPLFLGWKEGSKFSFDGSWR
jgi:hypothetical protein